MEKLVIAYYRVSTKAQGSSGLGLDAQRETVLKYISHNGNKLLAEFTETESGKNDHRPELIKAINKTKEVNGTLVISKLDRLSRNLSFISNLIDGKVPFICCDMPEATELTIHIFGAMAQWERKRISERTREALNAKRKREPSWKPGTDNLTDEGRAKGRATVVNRIIKNQANRHAYHFIKPLKEQGRTYQQIAEALNDEGYKTRQGYSFHGQQVWNIVKRFEG